MAGPIKSHRMMLVGAAFIALASVLVAAASPAGATSSIAGWESPAAYSVMDTLQPIFNIDAATPPTDQPAENPVPDLGTDLPATSNTDLLDLEQGTANWAGVDLGGADLASALAHYREGLNFVAYATDAVSWFHFHKYNGILTPSHLFNNLTVAQLAAIYEGTITNWNQVGGGNAPI